MAKKSKNKLRGKAKGKPKGSSGRTLDLHGKQQDEVFDLVDRFLLKESGSGAAQAKIMTGKGKGLVQKQVIDYLKKANYPWSYERLGNGSPNEGVLVVYLQ